MRNYSKVESHHSIWHIGKGTMVVLLYVMVVIWYLSQRTRMVVVVKIKRHKCITINSKNYHYKLVEKGSWTASTSLFHSNDLSFIFHIHNLYCWYQDAVEFKLYQNSYQYNIVHMEKLYSICWDDDWYLTKGQMDNQNSFEIVKK